MIRDNIHLIITTIDNHDAGIYPDGTHVCPCKFRGTREQWEMHIASIIDDQLAEQGSLL